MKFKEYLAETKFQSIKEYEKIARQFVNTYGRSATHKFLEDRPPIDKKQQGWQVEDELRREVYKAINKLLKKR